MKKKRTITIDVDEIINDKLAALHTIRALASRVIEVTHCKPSQRPAFGVVTGWRGLANIDGADLMKQTDRLKAELDKWHNTNT